MFKKIVFTIIIIVLHFFDKFFEKKYLITLLYHKVNDTHGSKNTVNISSFQKQMKWLCEHGYKTLRISEVDTFLKNYSNSKRILISFDDGYQDNLVLAAPIMARYGFTGVIFIATAFIGTVGRLGNDQDKMLNEVEISRLEDFGWDICNHFHSHHKLTELQPEQIRDEIKTSQAILRTLIRCKKNVNYFALPYNRHNREVEKILSEYNCSFFIGDGITKRSPDSKFIQRIEISPEDSLIKFQLKISVTHNLLKGQYYKLINMLTS
ncbi:polysaccharide deacetylase family protein [Candidatus Uhrbacteria bacterium]|nr:polysaccharide deacetylase family protein [Candidatus Uhrbacteria bacterium]